MTSMGIRQRLNEACTELVMIPSVTGDEAELAAHLERWALRCPGLSGDDIIRQGNCLIIGHADEQRPCIALFGHLDTIPPPPDYTGHQILGDRLYGRGACDMKGSIAVMQALFETLDFPGLPFSLCLVLYDREEGPFAENGLGPLLESYESLRDIDLGIVMEPTGNTLQLGCLGSLHARVTYHGHAAHSARPWEGENAVHKAGRLLGSLRDRPPSEVVIEGLTFRETLGITIARGGQYRSVVPNRFELNLNSRFAPRPDGGDPVPDVIAEIERLCGEATVEVIDVAPAGSVPAENPILEHLQSHARLPVEPKLAWTDVARLSAYGIDAVNLGPGAGAQAHQIDEWISIDAMVETFEVLSRVLTTPLEGL